MAVTSVDELRTCIISKPCSRWLKYKAKDPLLDSESNSTIKRLHLEMDKTMGPEARGCRLGIKCPIGISEDEWIAFRTAKHWQELLWIMAILDDICTCDTCPKMSAGDRVVYAWQEPFSQAPPEQLCAIEYVEKSLDWATLMLRDKTFIPNAGHEYPAHFKEGMRQMHKRFFRIYAHVYMHHFKHWRSYEAEPHLNACYKHWFFFCREFNLMDEEDMRPLAHLNKHIVEKHKDEDEMRESEWKEIRDLWEEAGLMKDLEKRAERKA